MSGTLDYLEPNELTAVQECALKVREISDVSLNGIWLFGSKARGDFHEDSDIDLLMVVHDLDSRKRSHIYQTAARCSLEYDVLINIHVLDKRRWDEIKRYQDTLWREIERDGVSLLDLMPITAQ